eukprot:336624-Rhodomonas_salina.2
MLPFLSTRSKSVPVLNIRGQYRTSRPMKVPNIVPYVITGHRVGRASTSKVLQFSSTKPGSTIR